MYGDEERKLYSGQYLHPADWEMFIDRCPDHRPSDSRSNTEERGDVIIWVLEVRDLGAIVMRADVIDGDVNHGMSIFTKEEIQFD